MGFNIFNQTKQPQQRPTVPAQQPVKKLTRKEKAQMKADVLRFLELTREHRRLAEVYTKLRLHLDEQIARR